MSFSSRNVAIWRECGTGWTYSPFNFIVLLILSLWRASQSGVDDDVITVNRAESVVMCAGTCWMLRAFSEFNQWELWWWRLAAGGVAIMTLTLSSPTPQHVTTSIKGSSERNCVWLQADVCCDIIIYGMFENAFLRFPSTHALLNERERDFLPKLRARLFVLSTNFPYKLRWKSADPFSRLRRVVADSIFTGESSR